MHTACAGSAESVFVCALHCASAKREVGTFCPSLPLLRAVWDQVVQWDLLVACCTNYLGMPLHVVEYCNAHLNVCLRTYRCVQNYQWNVDIGHLTNQHKWASPNACPWLACVYRGHLYTSMLCASWGVGLSSLQALPPICLHVFSVFWIMHSVYVLLFSLHTTCSKYIPPPCTPGRRGYAPAKCRSVVQRD